jgi:hypothetical protein
MEKQWQQWRDDDDDDMDAGSAFFKDDILFLRWISWAL